MEARLAVVRFSSFLFTSRCCLSFSFRSARRFRRKLPTSRRPELVIHRHLPPVRLRHPSSWQLGKFFRAILSISRPEKKKEK